MVIIIGLLTIASFCLIYCIIRYVQRRHSTAQGMFLERKFSKYFMRLDLSLYVDVFLDIP